MSKTTIKLARAGVIAGLYCLLSLITLPISGGAIQFRLSEGLNLLPILFPEAIPALFIGCLLFNFLSGLAFYDVVLGSVITLVSAVCVYLVGKAIKNDFVSALICGIFPILLNAFGLPLIWLYLCDGLAFAYWLQVVFLIISQSISIYLVGIPTHLYLKRLKDKKIKYFE